MFTREDSLKAVKKIKLSREEIDDLLASIKKGDRTPRKANREVVRAREELYRELNPLILSVVEKYAKSGIRLTELIASGEKGLASAIDHWDIDKRRQHKFVYYATWFIRAEIHKKLGLPVDVEGYGELRKE